MAYEYPTLEYAYKEYYEDWKSEWDSTVNDIKTINNRIIDSRKKHYQQQQQQVDNKQRMIRTTMKQLNKLKNDSNDLEQGISKQIPSYIQNKHEINKEFMTNMKNQLQINKQEASLLKIQNSITDDTVPIRGDRICNQLGSFSLKDNKCVCDNFADPDFFCGECLTNWTGDKCDECYPDYILNDAKNKCNLIQCKVEHTKNYDPGDHKKNINRNTGKCNTECNISWQGINCDTCALGWYGNNCENQVKVLKVPENRRWYSSSSLPSSRTDSSINSDSAWISRYRRSGQSIVLNLGDEYQVYGLRIQPNSSRFEYVREFKVQISRNEKQKEPRDRMRHKNLLKDSINVDDYKTYGNKTTDKVNGPIDFVGLDDYKDIFFNAPIQARYVKILPRKWWKKIAMRVDVLVA